MSADVSSYRADGDASLQGAMMGLSTLPSGEGVYVGSKIDYHAEGYTRLESIPRTHDISLSSRHIPNVERLAQDLSIAVKSAWSKDRRNRYSTVNVLLVGWKDDDLHVDTEIEDLGFLFKDQYGYDVQKYQIPSLKPDRALKERVLAFLKEGDREDSLLIFYYAGHARRNPQSNGASIWVANREPTSARLPSGGIQSLLEEADADVLFLYDCCHSAALPTSDSQSQDNGGVKEVLAACGFESIAPGVDKHSFTKALIETLALASRKLTFSIPELHSQVLSRIMGWTPGLMKDEDGKFVKNAEGPGKGRLALEREPRTTPIYSMLATTKSRRSIIISPLLPANRQPDTPDNDNANSNSSSTATTDLTTSNTPLKKRKRNNSEQAKYPQILVSIRLENDTLDKQAWLDYFRLMPPEAKDIKVEGVYQSFSTLVLLRLPIVVWDLLPENAAYTFVGFVTSENTVSTISHSEEAAKEESRVGKKKLEEEETRASLLGREPTEPLRDVSHLPKGDCRFFLLQPEAKGLRCACVGFALNESIPGSTCDCGHQACYHVAEKESSPVERMFLELSRARYGTVATKIGRPTEGTSSEETSTSANSGKDIRPFARLRKTLRDQVDGRPLSHPRFLETLDENLLRGLLQMICEHHPETFAEIIASAPSPSAGTTIELLQNYQQRLLEAFPFGGSSRSEYAYNHVRQPLIELIDAIADFIPQFLPPNETQFSVSLRVLESATKIIHELPEWDNQSQRHHKDNAYDEISRAWALVIKEHSDRGAKIQLLSGGWDIILRKHNERSGGRMQSAISALEGTSILGFANRSHSRPTMGATLSPESNPEVEALRNQLQSGSFGY